jgi:UDP-N-acetylmuramyl pentapeptide synthase
MRYHVQTNPRSYNTEIGLPLAVLNIEFGPLRWKNLIRAFSQAVWTAFLSKDAVEVLVLEFGTRTQGDMRQLLRTVVPDIAILTTLTPSYSTDVDLLRTLQTEMQVLCQTVGSRCHFLVDGDDPLLHEVIASLPTAPILLQRSAWMENSNGIQLQGHARQYAVTREVIGASERLSVQAAVALAEHWTPLSVETIRRFLTENEAVG